ncbi:hypothetical protein [Paraferrimonas sp. SM1919]|uniref:hypothetical protein n=1 Tax=Paraferrimonas sp. SM1919 TaxID=2662263 RepID=UPI001969ABF4|nr:hypothetical protein [Paraferrimonas sp. SM1919]
MPMSLPQKLFNETLAKVVEAFNMHEVLGPDGGPYLTLTSHVPMAAGAIGQVRVFEGGPLDKLVTCSIVVPAIFLDSHMIYGFMPANSPIPHFTLDSVKAGEHNSFHLDLTPRVDLGANFNYMQEIYQPLTELYEASNKIEGLTPAHISPRQRAIMSPWMMVNRSTDEAFEKIFPVVDDYFNHWLSIVNKGLSDIYPEQQLRERDSANRAMIFSAEIDPVWPRITQLIGEQSSQSLRQLLLGQ